MRRVKASSAVSRPSCSTQGTGCGQRWYFGMKAHIVVDAESGLVHRVRGTSGTSGRVNDVVEVNALLLGEEAEAWG